MATSKEYYKELHRENNCFLSFSTKYNTPYETVNNLNRYIMKPGPHVSVNQRQIYSCEKQIFLEHATRSDILKEISTSKISVGDDGICTLQK